MLPNYEDILSRIAEPPRWFDEQGVPRYCEFAPDRIANIRARECALLAIECQSCGRPFIVALDASTANHNVISPPGQERRTLADIIRSHQIEYRAPPNVECCGVGAMQTSPPRARILGAHQETYRESGTGILLTRGRRDWTRDHSLEIEIPDRE